MARCVNLDWLECHVLEDPAVAHDADFFIEHHVHVNVREYGTRVYAEMFTILDDHGNPFLEVRRKPKSMVMPANSVHLRLVNAYCYVENAADLMARFILDWGYDFIRIARIDVCLDFTKFDSGDDPQRFIRRYLEGQYSKINQANIHAHGTDTWNGRKFNSLSWGAPSSNVGTKMYNKTLELYDPITSTYDKPYIRIAWQEAGLIDDWRTCTLAGKHVDVWRVEFSVRSGKRKWMTIELNGKRKAYQSIRNTLDMWNERPKLMVMFASLANHYFHFKHYEEGVRKDRCKDKQLFDFKGQQEFYKLDRSQNVAGGHVERPLSTLISRIQAYKESHLSDTVRQACDVLLRTMRGEALRDETRLFSHAELEAFQFAMAAKSRGDKHDVAVLLREFKELLRINENVIHF